MQIYFIETEDGRYVKIGKSHNVYLLRRAGKSAIHKQKGKSINKTLAPTFCLCFTRIRGFHMAEECCVHFKQRIPAFACSASCQKERGCKKVTFI